MTAPRAREQADPPSPPDRLPPRRGGSPSSKTASAAARPAGFARLRGARRGLVRSARVLAAAALLALCGGLALPATAQAEVLVSNIEESADNSIGIRGLDLAQAFRTGASDSNFPLTSIEVKFLTVPSSGSTVTATVKGRNSSGRPGTDHATLVSPTSFVVGNNTFTAPAGTTLAANRTYFVVLETTSTSGPFINITNSDDEDGVPGWEMADGSMSSVSGNSFWTDRSQSVQIRVNGTDTGPPYVTAAEVSTDGQRIALTFNEILDHPTYTTTIRSAFTVTVDGTGTSVQSTSGGMAKVNLSVGRAISAGQTVVVSYDQSAAGTEALGDSDGNKVADFTTGRDGIPAVVNNSAADRSPPELTGATVASSGVAIELAFDEDLDLPATIPAALKDAFSVTAAGDTVEISGLAADGSSGLQIDLSSRILKDQAVVVSYDRSAAGTNALDDDAGNEVVDFTTGASGVPAVDNDSTQLSADATLSGLIFSVRNFDQTALETVDLSPAFDPGIEMYSVSLAFTKDQVTFMPAVNHADATVAYFDGDDMALEDADTGPSVLAEGHQVETAVGDTVIKVKVTAPDGMTEKTYTVTVTRELPTLRTASVQATGTSVLLQFEAQFPSGTGTLSAAAVAAFTVTADGVERQITGIMQGISENILDITLSTPIYKDQAVVVSYDSAAGLVDRDGNKYQSFTSGEDGVPAAANNSTVLRTAPGKPTGLEASASGDARIDLSWTAPASDGGSAITGYKIEVSTDGGTNWTDLVADIGNDDTRYTHTGLAPGSTRHYRVSAINAVGTSDASDVVSGTTATSCTLNTGDRWCGVVTVGNRDSGIYGFIPPFLTAPAQGNLSDKTFDGYTIDGVWTGTGANAGKLFFDLTSALSAADKARLVLHVGSASFALSAATGPSVFNTYNWERTGLDWSSDPYVTLRLRLGVPGQPANLVAEASGTTQIDLTWDAPGSGGSAITGYRIEVSEDGGTDWDDLVADTGNTDTFYSHTGLSPGDTRHYRVSAINVGGPSVASGTADATTIDPPTLSSAVAGFGGDRIALDFSENLDTSAGARPPASAFSVSADGASIVVGSVLLTSTTPDQIQLLSLDPLVYRGQTVTVTYTDPTSGDDAVAIQDSDGDDAVSFTTGEDGVPAVKNDSAETPPGPDEPTNFRATAGELQVALTWDAPASASGVTRHEYQYKTSGEYLDDWKQIADSAPGEANEASFTVTGLTGGTAYTFELRAVSAAGNSTAAEDGPVTPSAILTPPTIDDVAVTSTPLLTSSVGSTPDTYGRGETIEVSVTFNEPVTATTGTDFVLSVGEATRAPLLRGSGTDTLVFGYTVQTGDDDTDGIWIGDQDRTLVGDRNSNPQNGTIASVATTVAADLTHAELGALSGHRVDGSRRVTSTDATLSALVVTYGSSEVPLSPFFAPDTTAYTGSVVNAVAEVTVTPTTTHAAARIEYFDGDDVTLTDADTSDTVPQVTLEEDDNVIKVKVTAEDGITTRTYTVTVTRRAVDAGVEGQFRLNPDTVEDYSDEDEDRLNGHVGRVEVFHAERWGTVCRDGFSKSQFASFTQNADNTFTESVVDNDAPALVCQSMGYDTGEYASGYGQPGESQPSGPQMTYYPVGSTYPADGQPGQPGPLPIWLDDLTCAAGDADLTGDAALRAPLAHCGYAGWGLHNCSHGEDAGVRCWNESGSSMAAVAEPLTAAFEGLPEGHDGETAFSFRLAFSEAVAVTPEAMRTRVLTVAGGAATGAARVDGESGVWEITVTPDSREDLSIALAPTEDCEAEGAVCTSDGRALSVVPAHIVPGPGPETEPALTASFEGLPEAHDGEEGFHFRVAFSEEIGIGFRSMRDDSFTVEGGEVTGARRVDRRHDLWRITVAPDGEGDVTVTLAAGRECAVSGAICTRGGDRRQLTNTATATVAGPVDEDAPAVLTASFVEGPHEHDGETAFKLRIAFSEGISIGFRTFRDQSLSVSGGSVTKAKRVDRRKDLWEVTVKPGSLGDVTVTLAGGRACGTAGAVCTGDGRALSATISTTVLGPVALSVADARVREASDVTLDFAVTLSRASRAPVSVAYATADGSATAGSDYTATSGTLNFAAGETAKTVSVPVLDDAHDEGEETLTLRLSAATGAVIADGVATGTIENTDHMPAAWLARFGRTVTDQVLSVVEARLAAPRTAGVRATLAGQALPSWDDANDTAKAAAGDNADASDRALRADARDREAMTAIRDWMAHAGADGEWRAQGEGPEGAAGVQSRALTGRDFLTGTSFALTGGSAEAGGYAALWGRGAISRFDGREGDLTLDGEVTTALMGADWAAAPGSGSGAGRWTAGLAIGHARGTGGYSEGGGCTAGADDNGASGCAGEVEATLSGVWPYAGLTLTDRLTAWAAAGYGAGSLTLTPGGETDGPFTADLTMAMGAAGMRGEVLTPPPEGGLALALKGDARLTRTASEATKDAKGGNLAAATADVWLVRTGIEGSRRFAPGGAAAGLMLTPSFELGVRLDGGDAETGLGVDLGGGLAFAAPKQGIALDLKARGLVAHEAPGFREWGASASLAWDPRPSTERGPALTLRQSWGGSPTGGMDALLGRETLAGLAANENGDTTASAGRLEAELGYGIAMFSGGFTGTPHLGAGLSETGRDYRLGWRLTSARRGGPGFEINLDATRSEAANADEAPQHGLMLRGSIRW